MERPVKLDLHQKRFPIGQLAVTAAAHAKLSVEEIETALNRHIQGDWGNLSQGDKDLNDEALTSGYRDRILSKYEGASGVPFYIITDAGWQVTTVLLTSDY